MFIDSLESNGTKKFLMFDRSCEKIGNPKKFAGIAEAGTHRGLSTVHI